MFSFNPKCAFCFDFWGPGLSPVAKQPAFPKDEKRRRLNSKIASNLLFFPTLPSLFLYPFKQNLSRLIIPAFSSCNLSLCRHKLSRKMPLQEWTALVSLFFLLPLQLLFQSNLRKQRVHQHAGLFLAVLGREEVESRHIYILVRSICYWHACPIC